MALQDIFIAVGWLVVAVLFFGTLAIIFTDIFKKLTSEQRALFALVSPAVLGYVMASKFLGFTEPMGIIGLIGVLYLIVPAAFFYVQLQRVQD